MLEVWITDVRMRAQIDETRSRNIPPGITIEAKDRFDDGRVLIRWPEIEERFGFLTIEGEDLESKAHRLN